MSLVVIGSCAVCCGSGSDQGGISVGCCPQPLPAVLHVHVSGPICPGIDHQVVPIIYNNPAFPSQPGWWTGSVRVTLASTTMYLWFWLDCFNTGTSNTWIAQWGITNKPDEVSGNWQECQGIIVGGGFLFAVEQQCQPLIIVFKTTGMNIGVGCPSCSPFTQITWTVTQ